MLTFAISWGGALITIGSFTGMQGTTPGSDPRFPYSGVGYDVLPDGRFVIVRQPNQSTAREIVIVRNWLDELRRRMPAK